MMDNNNLLMLSISLHILGVIIYNFYNNKYSIAFAYAMTLMQALTSHHVVDVGSAYQ